MFEDTVHCIGELRVINELEVPVKRIMIQVLQEERYESMMTSERVS